MPGQAIITINGKQWNVVVANTLTELQTGQSGVESIPPQTGMLFDLGYDYKTIQIDMTQMLFPLDIIFINSTQGVVGVMHNVQPGETDVRLENEILPGARCFLEVNAGEAEGIEVGDNVNIQGYTQPAQLNIGSLIGIIGVIVMGIMMFKALAEPKERPKLPPAPLPRVEEELQERKLALEDKGREIARETGVEFVRLETGWEAKYATPRYWFRDPRGIEIIATDLKELKEKLSLIAKHHSMWLTLEQRKDLEKKYGAVAVRWAEEATRPSDIKGVEAAAEYYYKKLKEVFGLGHLSPQLTEEQIRKLREVLGLELDGAKVIKIHRKTGYIP